MQTVILDKEKAHEATAEILTTHCIPSDRSADLADAGSGPEAAPEVGSLEVVGNGDAGPTNGASSRGRGRPQAAAKTTVKKGR